ncbi:Xylose transport system permease protein XylH [Thermoflexales bacterium]|nr:Xylose transport system permease protein XylH [Thermoflexales bacterium]
MAFLQNFFRDLQKVLRQNIREYGMFIALFVIWAFFAITTRGTFLTARNISNLLNQTGYIAVMAVGVTLVIVIRHIDLSIGFLLGFLGAVAAIALKVWELPVGVVILLVLALGVVLGTIPSFMVANLGIPAFVATLAGWLAYRGLLVVVLAGTGTIIIENEFFNAIGNGYIPDIPNLTFLPEVHKLTLLLGLVAIILFIVGQLNDRKKKLAYNFEVLPPAIFVLKLGFVSVVGLVATWVLAGYNGPSWTMVIMLVVVAIYQFMTTQTILGRHIYAVGGNPEAAQLSGINVKKITYFVFCSMGLLTALAGILYASRLRSASPQAGNGFELDAIASAFIGGASPAGGIGTIVGSLIGALVYMSLTNGMNLMGTGSDAQNIVKGVVLAGAVIFDVATRSRAK